MASDQGCPVVEYAAGESPRQWGQMHGESFRDGIRELFDIRLALMREKNATLTVESIHRLAAEQWGVTAAIAPELTDELAGIAEGAGMTIEQMVVINNYTDFRDIQLSDEGCSMVFVNRDAGPIAGQTWDMHGSAKNYVCCLRIPAHSDAGEIVLFSLVGCVGMMGYSHAGMMVGVNNINTIGAVPGALWPVLVRRALTLANQAAMVRYLTTAPVTSGHNYLLASPERGEMWEIMPGLSERVSELSGDETGAIFHTNHCLGENARLRETTSAINSTTHIRYELLAKKIDQVRTLDDVHALLNDHENYPKSICSNFQADTQDPSITCGGAVGDLAEGRVTMWRGDAVHDANFQQHTFQLASRLA